MTMIDKEAMDAAREAFKNAAAYDYCDPDKPDPLESAITAYLQAAGWRTIDSAPKDGTPIIGGYFDVPWSESHMRGRIVRVWYEPEFSAFISSCRQMSLAPGYTFTDGSTTELHSPEIETVSHYIPLPTPPESRP